MNEVEEEEKEEEENVGLTLVNGLTQWGLGTLHINSTEWKGEIDVCSQLLISDPYLR